jgi:hypothetical protein
MNHKQIELGKLHLSLVRRFFEDHLCATQAECAKALSLSPMAVNRHVKAIRAEWKASPTHVTGALRVLADDRISLPEKAAAASALTQRGRK